MKVWVGVFVLFLLLLGVKRVWAADLQKEGIAEFELLMQGKSNIHAEVPEYKIINSEKEFDEYFKPFMIEKLKFTTRANRSVDYRHQRLIVFAASSDYVTFRIVRFFSSKKTIEISFTSYLETGVMVPAIVHMNFDVYTVNTNNKILIVKPVTFK